MAGSKTAEVMRLLPIAAILSVFMSLRRNSVINMTNEIATVAIPFC